MSLSLWLFYVFNLILQSTIEIICKNCNNKILAIYPMKALGREQENRWANAMSKAGLKDVKVGRIDGQVNSNRRKEILKSCNIVIMTPDVMHAWLLPNIIDNNIAKFIQQISLIIVDEIHTYTGVFGSNSAFLFRRLRHLMSMLETYPQFICASATIANPVSHLQNLFGIDFNIIGEEFNSSPRHNINIKLLTLPRKLDFLTEAADLLEIVSNHTNRFIAFVDSRKQVELITSILSRKNNQDTNSENEEDSRLNTLNILPYRAGYEEQDREQIQKRLSQGSLKGVVSTSALELGLDINGLDSAVLIGVPSSSTSLFQRIGRIGRNCEGTVYVINSGSLYDEMIFRHPGELLKRPLAESALYLENQRIQYIHALCLARQGGEYDQLCSYLKEDNEVEFKSEISWPQGFIPLCESERIGEVPTDLQSMKLEAGDNPNHTYPLRDAESQFKVKLKQGPNQRDMGSLSFSQLLRETYPCAVYYYATEAYRVYKVNLQTKEAYVRPEKKYTTSPSALPTLVFPNLTQGNVYSARKNGELITFEANLQVRESLGGFEERRGLNKSLYKYPVQNNALNLYYENPRFTRNYFTSGVIFTHPEFGPDYLTGKDDLKNIGNLIYESFLISIPFERQDISWAIDKFRDTRSNINTGDRFISIFDRTYGSLRLSGRVMTEGFVQLVFSQARELADINDEIEISTEAKKVLEDLLENSKKGSNQICFDTNPISSSESCERVILPDSIGLALNNGNQEFIVERVFFNPRISGLCYSGKYVSQRDDSVQIIWPITSLAEIPGESKMGVYNYDTGELK